jgi:hypothetical protein
MFSILLGKRHDTCFWCAFSCGQGKS